jgi:hypothetical protein
LEPDLARDPRSSIGATSAQPGSSLHYDPHNEAEIERVHLTIDPFLPFFVCPATDAECYVVRGRRAGPLVEISLTREHRETHRFGSDTYTPLEVLAVKRFPRVKESAYMSYADSLEDAARYAARGELGYHVHTVADTSRVRVALVARLLGPDGQVDTEISHEHYFEDPDSQAALIQANEEATELRALAQQLNDEWVSRRRARVLELQTEYEKADALAQAAQGLRRIVDAERD